MGKEQMPRTLLSEGNACIPLSEGKNADNFTLLINQECLTILFSWSIEEHPV